MKILLEDSETGQVWNLTGAVTQAVWESSRRPSAGKLEVTYQGGLYPEGSLVRLTEGERAVFQGRLFQSSHKRSGEVRAVAYDQLRHLKAKDDIVRKSMTLDQLVRTGCAAFGLRVGELAATGLCLPKKIYDNKEWLSSLEDSIREHSLLTGEVYCLYDKGGAIALEELEERKLPLILGEGSLAYDWERSRSIEDASNLVKLVDKKGGGLYVYRDSDTQARWGTLQHTESLPDGYNRAQIDLLGKAILLSQNRPKQTLTLSCLGDSRVSGGTGIKVVLPELGVGEWLVVERATHTLTGGGQHTMKLELGVRS